MGSKRGLSGLWFNGAGEDGDPKSPNEDSLFVLTSREDSIGVEVESSVSRRKAAPENIRTMIKSRSGSVASYLTALVIRRSSTRRAPAQIILSSSGFSGFAGCSPPLRAFRSSVTFASLWNWARTSGIGGEELVPIKVRKINLGPSSKDIWYPLSCPYALFFSDWTQYQTRNQLEIKILHHLKLFSVFLFSFYK